MGKFCKASIDSGSAPGFEAALFTTAGKQHGIKNPSVSRSALSPASRWLRQGHLPKAFHID
jgi:hypothetical protein